MTWRYRIQLIPLFTVAIITVAADDADADDDDNDDDDDDADIDDYGKHQLNNVLNFS